jgi:hypothetical protein
MSLIKNDIDEFTNINIEIKRLSTSLKELRNRAGIIEKRIIEYLEKKDQPGLKYNNKAIVVKDHTKRIPKKKSQRSEDAMRVLQEYGISNAADLLERISEAQRGQEIENKQIKIKNVNNY